MSEHSDSQNSPDDKKPLNEGLPRFPTEAESTLLESSPGETSWGWSGFWSGTVLGAVAGAFVLTLSLATGALDMDVAFIIFVVLPISGAVYDRMREPHDLAKQREAERREDENREWYGVRHPSRRKDDEPEKEK
jgi:hypothetical protein